MPAAYDDEVTLLLPLPTARSVTRPGIQRDAEAARLKALGWTLEEIADHLNLGGDPRRAAACIRRALGSAFRFAKDEARAMELQSYDELEAVCWRQLRSSKVLVQQGRIIIGPDGEALTDDRFTLEVVDRILKIKESRAKLLGLNAPTRSEVITIDSVEAEIQKLEKELEEYDLT